ncbi:MAG: cation transporter [Bacteroidota bacterium]
MKKLLIVLLAGAFMLACNNQTKSSEDAATETPAMAAEWVEVVLNVDGMTCDGCENAINGGVESLEGIASVESSHEEGWTKVKYDKNLTSVEDIEGKITETGYVVED